MDRFEITNAPCQSKEIDPEIFFPDPTDLDTTRKAKLLCLSCKSQFDCLSFAMKTNSHGIWGGKTDDERRSIKRKMYRSNNG